jgi:hypothetical protein
MFAIDHRPRREPLNYSYWDAPASWSTNGANVELRIRQSE